jgi:signal transduction histidine kinase
LNHDTQNRKKTQLSGQAGMSPDNSTTASDVSVALTSNESGSDINILTEDAVTAACLGFDLRILQSRDLHGADGDHPATLVLNIEEALMCDWSFSVASGSWKRICMNLVSNALKYTPSGYILVTLRKTSLKRKPGKQQIALVELIVSWTFNY